MATLSTRSRLPSSLLDLTWLRISTRANHGTQPDAALPHSVAFRRRMHSVQLASSPSGAFHPPVRTDSTTTESRHRKRRPGAALAVRRPQESEGGALAELERRVETLADITLNDTTQEINAETIPEFTENDLMAFYEDILAAPQESALPTPSSFAQSQIEMDMEVVDSLAQHFALSSVETQTEKPSSFLASLGQRANILSDLAMQPGPSTETVTPALPHQKLVQGLKLSVRNLLASRKFSALSGAKSSVPIVVLTQDEWDSLIRVCLHHGDAASAESALELMKHLGEVGLADSMKIVMELYARHGDIAKVENLMHNFLTGPPDEKQRHLHIKTHENSVSRGTVPDSALSLLHNYEEQRLPAPMTTYTRLITALFSVRSPLARAQAWDLFSHMRYVAHPDPDVELYTRMIRACAPSNGDPEPERALDLFTEMTVDRGLTPTEGAYSAIILACARAGSKTYVNEAFRLAKEMLNAHRDAHGRSAFRPEGRTFAALLEGAKRVGDLTRTRWILAELVQATRPGVSADEAPVNVEIDEAIMMHVFHAYATYRPPFNRSIAPQADEGVSPSHRETSSQSQPESEPSPPIETKSNAKQLPPQSKAEVVREATALFGRIVEDSTSPSPSAVFHNVRLTARLLNSYLSVHYAHGEPESAANLFDALFREHGVEKTARTYVEALERCANARKGRDREEAAKFAERVWAQWTVFEDASPMLTEDPSSARMVERAHAAIIRVLTLTNQLDRAITHLKRFATRYPPTALRAAKPLPSLRDARIVLSAPRPIVRLTTVLDIPDETVPPMLTFADLEILHHRLVAAGDREGLRFVKWACKAYEGSLRMRRENVLKGGRKRAAADGA
ncbi:hypothetical protein OF83DRAFT_1144310 [Amylostereum chailletii]|nr:hypothetical protein OF83DRAFT_1144310 [Amylostereum chailletii]